MDYDFARNVSKKLINAAKRHLMHLRDVSIDCLEIGVFERRGGCWLLDNLLLHSQSHYTGIDHWRIGEREQRALHNLGLHGSRVTLLKGNSQIILREMPTKERFNLVHIDGGHDSLTCLADAVLVWPLLRTGGILMWDDYTNEKHPEVRVGVDAFLASAGAAAKILWQDKTVGVKKAKAWGAPEAGLTGQSSKRRERDDGLGRSRRESVWDWVHQVVSRVPARVLGQFSSK